MLIEKAFENILHENSYALILDKFVEKFEKSEINFLNFHPRWDGVRQL